MFQFFKLKKILPHCCHALLNYIHLWKLTKTHENMQTNLLCYKLYSFANCRNQSSKQTLKNYKLGINHLSYFSSVHSNLRTQNMRLQSHTLGIKSPNTKQQESCSCKLGSNHKPHKVIYYAVETLYHVKNLKTLIKTK